MKNVSRKAISPAGSTPMIAAARPRVLIATNATPRVSGAANFTAGPRTRHGNMRCRCAPTSARLCAARISIWIESALPNAERQHAVRLRLLFQPVAGLLQQVGDVDGGERIGAFSDNQVAAFQSRQFLAHPQRRQRAFQSAQIHYGFSHALSGTIESCLSAA